MTRIIHAELEGLQEKDGAPYSQALEIVTERTDP